MALWGCPIGLLAGLPKDSRIGPELALWHDLEEERPYCRTSSQAAMLATLQRRAGAPSGPSPNPKEPK